MRQVILVIVWLMTSVAWAQDQMYVTRKFDENNGLSQGHATQILQDRRGLIWIATWNGLNRYDGYEFRRMTSRPGDGCTMPSDRLRDIWLSDRSDELFCQVDDSLFVFDLLTYQFRDIRSEAEREHGLQLQKQTAGRGSFNGKFIHFIDKQGQEWQLHRSNIWCQRPVHQPCVALPQEQPTQIRCLHRDGKGRIWLTTKEDATVRLFDGELQPKGYLTQEGRLSQRLVSWEAPVYCVAETRSGTFWLGSKPGGLFRLQEKADGCFTTERIGGLTCTDIYDIKEDRQGRLWVATLGGGICCVEHPDASVPTVVSQLKGYPSDLAARVRYIHLTADDKLLATTTEGLIIGEMGKNVQESRFRLHRKEADRQTSLTCNATMDVFEDSQHRLYVSTESGGVCQIVSQDLLADTLTFVPCPMKGGWPTNVALSLTGHQDRILITSSNQLIDYQPQTGEGLVFDESFFGTAHRFSEVPPLLLDDGRWLLGTMQGAYTLAPKEMIRTPYVPPMVLTGITIQNGQDDLAVDDIDTLRLSPQERSLSIHFAALDYTNPERIRYAFRLGDDSAPWNALGHDHTVTLLDLKPGTYALWLQSTNADGQWVDNQRRIVIIAEPTFWETPWAILLLIVLGAAILATVIYTYLYIRRIKRQRQETLEAYLALLSVARNEAQTPTDSVDVAKEPSSDTLSPEDDAFMKRVVAFVEQNIGNSDADINQMAEAAAVSRSGLQRKMKQLLGVTPLDFIREARIKQACHLLRTTEDTVSDIAYKCGFSDPKYFSRSFKQSVGMSPKDYKQAV